MSKESVDFFKDIVKKYEPYPLSVFDDYMFDDKRYDDKRIGATSALRALILAGYTEEEANPWLKKTTDEGQEDG